MKTLGFARGSSILDLCVLCEFVVDRLCSVLEMAAASWCWVRFGWNILAAPVPVGYPIILGSSLCQWVLLIDVTEADLLHFPGESLQYLEIGSSRCQQCQRRSCGAPAFGSAFSLFMLLKCLCFTVPISGVLL